MKAHHPTGLLCFAAALAVAIYPAQTRADWDPGMDHKMHYPQLPDQTSTGMDVGGMFLPLLLGDDFTCRATGPITGVHVWASWYQDNQPLDIPFHISIWSDWPTNEQHQFSTPSNLLWECFVSPNEYVPRLYFGPVTEGEWFYDPFAELAIPGADSFIWQYNFYFPEGQNCEPFTQYVGNVYWLMVGPLYSPSMESTNIWGWKTTDPNQTPHHLDDAVWSEPGTNLWKELLYPSGIAGNHPYGGQSIDLAFVINGSTNPPTPPPPTLTNDVRDPKWDQPLDPQLGICVPNFRAENGEVKRSILDDFVSDGRPINGARWWGCYPGYRTNQPGPVPLPGTAAQPQAFRLDWRADVPAGVDTNYSHPGKTLDSLLLSRSSGAGSDPITENYYTSTIVPGKGYQHHFVYDATFPTNYTWNEKEGVVYWFSAQAEYFSSNSPFGWAWSTTLPRNHWNDDAARFTGASDPSDWEELFYHTECPGHPYGSNSIDLAFTLYSDVLCRRAKKWVQPPDMKFGENMWSYQIVTEPNSPQFLRADDFISDGRLITDIHWWGSYLNYLTNYAATNSPPQPPGNLGSPAGFRLSWHADGTSAPAYPPIEDIFVPMSRCHEVFYGTVTQSWKDGAQEHEYQYYVDLLDPALSNSVIPWNEQTGIVYWLNIQAVFSNWSPGVLHDGWGWKSTLTNFAYRSPSVIAMNLFGPPAWVSSFYPSSSDQFPPGVAPFTHPFFPQQVDLAFELTTVEVGTNQYYQPPRITKIEKNAYTNIKLSSVGDLGAGIQVLQCTTNLLPGPIVWTDVSTNFLPRSPPWTNYWWVIPKSTNEVFWRVWQSNKPAPAN